VTSLAAYAARRAVGAVLFVLVVAGFTLGLARVTPGAGLDPGVTGVSAEEVRQRRAELGLDRPFVVQYARWVGGLLRLDLGWSTLYSRPVADLVVERAANTAILAAAALLLATLIGIPLGRVTALSSQRSARLIRCASLVVLSVPPLIGSLLLVLLAARTGWLPVGGMTSGEGSGVAWLADVLRHLPVPTLSLALPVAATLERLQAQSLREAAGRPFVRASLARGRTAADAVTRHAWPASLAPLLGVYGVIVAGLFSGSFVVEVVTAWPGLGRLLFDALRARDVWLVAGCGSSGAGVLALATFVADVAHAALDPRVRQEARS
jgi:peptide/nickel transport system permease protein